PLAYFFANRSINLLTTQSLALAGNQRSKRTRQAMLAGKATNFLFRHTASRICRAASSTSRICGIGTFKSAVIGVRTQPRQTIVVVNPLGRTSTRTASKSAFNPDLLAQYAAIRGNPRNDAKLEIPTSWPRPLANIPGNTAAMLLAAPIRFT